MKLRIAMLLVILTPLCLWAMYPYATAWNEDRLARIAAEKAEEKERNRTDAEWRALTSITIETPEGLKTGEVVRWTLVDVVHPDKVSVINYAGHEAYYSEALALEVKPGRWLIGIIKDSTPIKAHTVIDGNTLDRQKWYRDVPSGTGRDITGNADFPGELVTFRDINDPATIEKVDLDNLEATFGPGYRFVSGRFEFTDKPITHGRIAKVLPWLGSLKWSVIGEPDFKTRHQRTKEQKWKYSIRRDEFLFSFGEDLANFEE